MAGGRSTTEWPEVGGGRETTCVYVEICIPRKQMVIFGGGGLSLSLYSVIMYLYAAHNGDTNM